MGDTTKWVKNGVNPTITLYVMLRITSATGTAFAELYDESTNSSITASEVSTISTDITNVEEIVIPQANFPTPKSIISIRTKRSTAGTLELRGAQIRLEWVVA